MKFKLLFLVLLITGSELFAQDYTTSIVFPATYQVGDYVEFLKVSPTDAGSSGYYQISISYTRGNIAAAASHLASISHSNPAVWREVGRVNGNPYVSNGVYSFTIDCNTEYNNARFRVRAINTYGVSAAIAVNITVHAINNNSSWTTLNNTGNDLTVNTFLPMTDEWTLYTGNDFSAAGANLAIKATEGGNVGINTADPLVKLTTRSNVNALPATSGTNQSAGAFRVEGGDNAVIDFGANSVNTWIQATDKTSLASLYNLNLNPNGGNVGIGTTNPGDVFQVSNGSTTRFQVARTQGIWVNNEVNGGTPAAPDNLYLNYSSHTNTLLNLNGGNVGIGTTSPSQKFVVSNGGAEGLEVYTNQPNGTVGLQVYNRSTSAYNKMELDASQFALMNGNVGIGITNPLAMLHISDAGSSSNAYAQFNGDLIIQGNPGNRTSTTGASLEFVTPANTDGSNPWGQGRIITVAGNTYSGNATGKMILGTRRWFDKGTGIGTSWNYGDDIVITGDGSVGVGTTTTPAGYKFAVAGNVIAESMTVKLQANWPDYTFKKDYKLMPLSELKTYVDKNQHLPEVPSAAEVAKDGQNLGEMNKLLLKKVEELTLYLIEKDKQIKEISDQLKVIQTQLKQQK